MKPLLILAPLALAACAQPLAPAELPAAELAPVPPPPGLLEADWSRDLHDLLPVLQGCLARTPTPPAVALKAWPMNHGLAGAWTRGADGRRWDCTAQLADGRVERLTPLAATTQPPDAGAPIFVPDPQPAPEGACSHNERARDAGGAAVGWLSYRGC